MTRKAIVPVLVACLALSATGVSALTPEQANAATDVYNQLKSEGYDVTNFDNLTLSQIALIRTQLDKAGNKQLIQGMLNGVCGGSVMVDVETLKALTN